MKVLIIIIFVLSALIAKLIFSQSNITYDGTTSIEIQTGADVCADAIIINGTYTGGGTICNGPLPVVISSFSAAVIKNNVGLSWVTEYELNNTGFEIERTLTTLNSPERGTFKWAKVGFVQGSGTSNEPRSYFYEDKKLNTGKYKYRLKQIDFNGNYEYFSLESDVIIGMPADYMVSQNYPNPSNPRSKIDYQIPVTVKVNIKVYDLLGREVITLVNETKEAGYYTVEFDGSNFASGVYFYKLIVRQAGSSTGDYVQIKKMILVK